MAWKPSDDVELFTCPWVSGTRAKSYFGPIRKVIVVLDGASIGVSDVFESMHAWLERSMKDEAKSRGANAVVGMELELNPFLALCDGQTGMSLSAAGTAADLESLW